MQVVCTKVVRLTTVPPLRKHMLDVVEAADIVYQSAQYCLQSLVASLAWLVANLQLLHP